VVRLKGGRGRGRRRGRSRALFGPRRPARVGDHVIPPRHRPNQTPRITPNPSPRRQNLPQLP